MLSSSQVKKKVDCENRKFLCGDAVIIQRGTARCGVSFGWECCLYVSASVCVCVSEEFKAKDLYLKLCNQLLSALNW